MSKPTVSAAGGAMPAPGQPLANLSEADRKHRLDLLDITDDIDEVRHLLEATWMAVESFSTREEDRDAQSALHAVLDVAKAKADERP